MCGYMDQSYLPFVYIVSQKMVSHFYVFGFGMEHWVLCNAYGTCAITLKWVSYGPPWAHYLGGYQDRLLGGPLGLPVLRYTAPDGVEHKDYGEEVLG
jgi:hypothetical protein